MRKSLFQAGEFVVLTGRRLLLPHRHHPPISDETHLILAGVALGAFALRLRGRHGELAADVRTSAAHWNALDSRRRVPRWAATIPTCRRVEHPAHRVRVNGFWMDETDVTNANSAPSPKRPATSHGGKVRLSKNSRNRRRPGAPLPKKEELVAGSLVFTPPDHPCR